MKEKNERTAIYRPLNVRRIFRAEKSKNLRDPFLSAVTEEEAPQVTPSKQPHGTRKAPFSAAPFPT